MTDLDRSPDREDEIRRPLPESSSHEEAASAASAGRRPPVSVSPVSPSKPEEALLASMKDMRESLLHALFGAAKGSKEQMDAYRRAYRHGQNLMDEIEARMPTQQQRSAQQVVGLRGILQPLLEEIAPKAGSRKMRLILLLEGDIKLRADPYALRRLLSLWIHNLIVSAPEGSTFDVRPIVEREMVFLNIRDRAASIDDHLFLAFVHRPIFARFEQGQIQSGGAPAQAEDSSREEVVPVAKPDVLTRGATILIVDDDPYNAALVIQALRKAGYSTAHARHGLQALTMARDPDVGLVILDLMLPGMDGYEVCNRLKTTPETQMLPIVMVSAKAREADVDMGMKVGADAYLSKPLSVAKLLETVERHSPRRLAND